MRQVIRLALPVVITYLGTMAMALVDLLAVGRVSAVAIGAVGLGSSVFSWVMIFGIGLLTSLDYLVSHADGAGRREDGARYLVQALGVSIGLGIPLSALLVFLSGHLDVLGVRPEVAAEAGPYLKVLAPSLAPLFLFISLRQYLQAHGSVRLAMGIMLLANIVNAAANYALVFGHWGLPALGTVGSAWATLISRFWMLAALGLYVVYWDRAHNQGLLRRVRWRMERSHLGPILKLGWPSALQMSLEVGVFATTTALAARLAPVDLAAHQLVLNTASLTFMVPLGISSSAAVLVGQAKGRLDPAGARRIGWQCLRLGVGFMACSCIVLLCLPDLILRAYTADAAVIEAGKRILLVAALFQLSDGGQAVATGTLRGLGETRASMLFNLLGHWGVGLPLGILLGFGLDQGLRGLLIGLSVGLTVVGIALVWRWKNSSDAALADRS